MKKHGKKPAFLYKDKDKDKKDKKEKKEGKLSKKMKGKKVGKE